MLAYRSGHLLVHSKLVVRGIPGFSESLQKEVPAGSQHGAFERHASSLASRPWPC